MNRNTQETLEARFGYRAAARLSESADTLPHDINERLKAARFQAIARRKVTAASASAATSAAQSTASHVTINASGSASLSGMPGSGEQPMWMRAIGFLLPGIVLAATLIGLSEWQNQQQIGTIAEIDAAMLADELPTQAYADPGFAQFLKAEAEAADNAAGL